MLAMCMSERRLDGIIQRLEGTHVYRYQPPTNNIFIGTLRGGKNKFFYKWDGRNGDAVIEALKRLGKM